MKTQDLQLSKEAVISVIEKESLCREGGSGMPTWLIAARLERDGLFFTCAEIRKVMSSLVASGVVKKHWASRRGQAVWSLNSKPK